MNIGNIEIFNLTIVGRENNNFKLCTSLSYFALILNLIVGVKFLSDNVIFMIVIFGISIRIASILLALTSKYDLMAVGQIDFFKGKIVLQLNKQIREVDLVKTSVKIGRIRKVKRNGDISFLNRNLVDSKLYVVPIKVKSDLSSENFELLLTSEDEVKSLNNLKSILSLS
jgi:hypothetical protein